MPTFIRSNCAERDWQSACHVCRMVLVFRECRRVLRDDGVMWLNYGDSYSGGKIGRTDMTSEGRRRLATFGHQSYETEKDKDVVSMGRQRPPVDGLPSGNLCGVPWRVALALQADGWILRSDVPWLKRSPMPESCKNRPAKALEYVFMLVKRQGYYSDFEAVKKVSATPGDERHMGSGTTAAVCVALGRRCWGIDLSAAYLALNARPRIEGALLARGLGHLLGQGPKSLLRGKEK